MHFEVKYCILPSFQKTFPRNLNGYDTELDCLISKEDTVKFFFTGILFRLQLEDLLEPQSLMCKF